MIIICTHDTTSVLLRPVVICECARVCVLCVSVCRLPLSRLFSITASTVLRPSSTAILLFFRSYQFVYGSVAHIMHTQVSIITHIICTRFLCVRVCVREHKCFMICSRDKTHHRSATDVDDTPKIKNRFTDRNRNEFSECVGEMCLQNNGGHSPPPLLSFKSDSLI